jgi:hypothetical protein
MIVIAAKGEVVAEMVIDVTHAVTEIRLTRTRHSGLPGEITTVGAVACGLAPDPRWMIDTIDRAVEAAEMMMTEFETEAHVVIGMAAANGPRAPNAPRANLRHRSRRKMSVIVERFSCSSSPPG